MCGLVVLLKPGRYVDAYETLGIALDAMAHRGLPGRRGSWVGDVAIGHVRLPIRGLGELYDQPFVRDGWAGAFVGEVFDIDMENDSIYALEQVYHHGPEIMSHHDGFWAMALHDRTANHTTIMTDHLSIKPLYYHISEGVVASELRAIEAICPNLTINRHYISNVLKWGYDPSGGTPYCEVRKLKNGTSYDFHKGRLVNGVKYFNLKPRHAEITSVVSQAVMRRLVSDVPVASLCSGGLDSTIVSLLAAEYADDLTVFHVDNGESEYLEMIDWPVNVKLVKLPLVFSSLEMALRATEEPVDLGSVLPQYQLGRAVHKAGFKVVLSGDGADELFGGYRRAQEYDSQYSDIFSELVHYHLPRLDKTMMASTVELRSPFLAPDVVQTALAVPHDQRTKKQMLKAAFSDIVPKAILEREKKPLKTKAVIEGGLSYRQAVVDMFLKSKGESR